VTADKWVYGGDSLSRLAPEEGRAGKVVLTPFLIPGEIARVEPEQERPDLIRTKAIEIVSKSEHRVEPPCPYFMTCGGCNYQHAEYRFQVEQKIAILREQLKRVGKVDYTGEIHAIQGEPYGYRNRTQFHVQGEQIGYFEAGTHKLLPVDQCPISSPKINEVLKALNAMTRDPRWPKFLGAIEVFTNEAQVLVSVTETERPVARRFFEWCAEQIPGTAGGSLEYTVGGDLFRVSHNSFFQVNRFLAQSLVETALAGAEGESALDLYAGVGLFSVALARKFQKVTAVESGKSAIHDLKSNAQSANVAMLGVAENVEQYLPTLNSPPDFVLADPPRTGLGKVVVRELLRLRPRILTIVSCDPSTLARDLSALLGSGYSIDRLSMIDLFPQTFHIESVVSLRLN
jgi:23S rRNA (uracil1939-C5)-methyltransferase